MQVLLIISIPVAFILLQNDFGSALVYSSLLILLYREGMHPSIPLLMLLGVAVFIAEILWDKLYLLFGLTLLSIGTIMVITRKYWPMFRLLLLLCAVVASLYLLDQWFRWGWSLYYLVLVSTCALAVLGVVYGLFKRRRVLAVTASLFLLSVAISFSVDYVMTNVLSNHHQRRIYDLLGVENDPLGWGYNVNQSKIAIGSGGFFGKGYLQGTQTKFNFVPEQSTDFIFCTVGEEWGFLGSLVVIGLFVLLLLRLIKIAERQRDDFSRIYGYGVLGVLFFHFAVNIAMTVGLFPVIGIPLPFFSYGGSSLWAFTILLFILVKLDASRMVH